MIDFGAISVMFKPEFVKEMSDNSILLPSLKGKLGLSYSGQIDFDLDGNAEVSRLNHRFESIPSSFASLAFLFVDGTDFVKYPYIRICGNPAKLLQGHNVYGSDDAELCLFAVLEAFMMAMPHLSEFLDWTTANIDYIDVTYTARIENDNTALQVLQVLKNVSAGQTKNKTSDDYLSTVYWGKGTGKNKRNSRRKQLKAYLKTPELMNSIKEVQKKLKKSFGDKTLTDCLMRQLAALNQPDVQKMAEGAIRFESRLFAPWLFDNGLPVHVFDFMTKAKAEPTLLKHLWQKSWQDVFKSFEGAKMHLHNDAAIQESLRTHFYRENKSGVRTYTKASKLFNFYIALKTLGFEAVYRDMDRATFSRHLADLKTAGLSRAQLHNLTAEVNNVVPLVRLINIDFNTQLPDNWQEPQPLRDQVKRLNPMLKIAS